MRGADGDGHDDSPDRLLVWVIRTGAGWLLLLLAATTAYTGCALLLPAMTAAAADAALRGERLMPAMASLVVVLGAGTLAALGMQLAEAYATAAATRGLRLRLVTKTLALGLPGQRRFSSGDLASRAVSGVPQAAGAVPLLVQGLAGILMSAGGAIALWRIDWRLVVTIGVAAPAGFALLGVFVRRTTRLVTRYQELQAEIATRMTDALAGVRTIRAAGSWRREADRILTPLPELAASGRALWHGYGQMEGRGALLAPLTGLVALAVAGQGVLAGRISPGEMLAVAGYTPMALGLLGQLSLMVRFARQRAGLRRIAEVLSVPAARGGSRALPPGSGELTLCGVTVRDGERALLQDVDLRVPGGSAVAVVGRSGSGKSTLAAIAGRLLDPDGGSVLLDGVPLRELATDALRAEVTYAFERPVLLGTTVADAIRYGCERLPPGRAERAAALARADEFVRRLPQGFATPLPGVPLSGGEEQRLGLARAFARAGRLLILDDATSSLDSVTEAQVAAALADPAVGRTRLIVAHRAGTAARADLVAWLDHGKVRAVGRHDELWSDPAYRALFEPEHYA
jgi:ATP-binding cassette subfamily B protein